MTASASGNCGADTTGIFGLMIPAFSPAISVKAVAEPFLMIEIDRRDHRNDRLGSIGCVEPAAHPSLEDDEFRFAFLEMQKAERGCDFKERRMRIPVGDECLEFSLGRGHLVFRNLFAIDLNSLAKSDEMRGGEEPGPITLRAQMESIIAQTEPLPLVPAT